MLPELKAGLLLDAPDETAVPWRATFMPLTGPVEPWQ